MIDNSSPSSDTRTEQLNDTRRAFDSVAPAYDGPIGNNVLAQRMRRQLWEAVDKRVPRGARLLDLGCGTGIDAVRFAARGYDVLAVDWSSEMVSQTRHRIQTGALERSVEVQQRGIHELNSLPCGAFQAIYSNLGVLNCAVDLDSFASECTRLLEPNGLFAASVIGRVCPWELAYYLLRGQPRRAAVRFRKNPVPVPLNGHTVWTRYYTPGEFEKPFADEFVRMHLQTMHLFLPPPYLIRLYEISPSFWRVIGKIEEAVAGIPGIRRMGDHFLIVLRRRR